MIRKLFDRYMATTQKAAHRSSDSYEQYLVALAKFDQIIGPPHVKSTAQKRLHYCVNQQSTIMCASLQNVEDIVSILEEMKDLLQQPRNLGDYNFQASTPFYFFPVYLQKYFSNPILSPSKMKLMTKKLPKKTKRLKKKKKEKRVNSHANNNNNIKYNDSCEQEKDMDDLFNFSDDDDDDDDKITHSVVDNSQSAPEIIIRDFFVGEAVASTRRHSVVSRDAFTDQAAVSHVPVARHEPQTRLETIQDPLCLDEDTYTHSVKRSSFVSHQSFTNQCNLSSSPNVNRPEGHTSEEHVSEQDVVCSPQNVSRKRLAPAGSNGKVAWDEDASCCDRELVQVLPSASSHTGKVVSDTHLIEHDEREQDLHPHPQPLAVPSSTKREEEEEELEEKEKEVTESHCEQQQIERPDLIGGAGVMNVGGGDDDTSGLHLVDSKSGRAF